MLRIRRNRAATEPRVELIPLIDVMMFLLTFFLYAFVLIPRVELLPMELQRFAASRPAHRQDAVIIHLDLAGRLLLGSEPIDMDQILPRLREIHDRNPESVIYLALADGQGTVDRAPLLTELWDRLKDAGLKINIVGRPKPPAPAPTPGLTSSP